MDGGLLPHDCLRFLLSATKAATIGTATSKASAITCMAYRRRRTADDSDTGFVDGETGAYSHYAIDPVYRRQTEAEALMRLRDAVPAAARDWCDAAELVRAGKPYRQIVQQAEDHQADVIVMGIRGRGGADLMLLGSTTNRVVREAACPVLTVRAKQSQVRAHPP